MNGNGMILVEIENDAGDDSYDVEGGNSHYHLNSLSV